MAEYLRDRGIPDSAIEVDANALKTPHTCANEIEGDQDRSVILISQRLVQDDKFTSIHIEKYEVDARETKLGPEEITRDIPNVGEEALKDLDERGIIRIGAEVGPGELLRLEQVVGGCGGSEPR